LRLKHGFDVEEIPLDFHGFRVRYSDRLRSSNPSERRWRRRERIIDVGLATRMIRRCLASDHPWGVLLFSGDQDFAYALREIRLSCPRIRVGVAAFRSALSRIYWSKTLLGCTWKTRPILLDKCITEMRSARR
jgi:hypothetical protein